MIKRFVVKECGKDSDKYYRIEDIDGPRFNLPKFATTLNFATFDRADSVAHLLNEEWQRFLTNPY